MPSTSTIKEDRTSMENPSKHYLDECIWDTAKLRDLAPPNLINYKVLIQKDITWQDIFPDSRRGLCRCGCGEAIDSPNKRWYSDLCMERSLFCYRLIHGSADKLMPYVIEEKRGVCDCCSKPSENGKYKIMRKKGASEGGGAVALDSLELYCRACLKELKSPWRGVNDDEFDNPLQVWYRKYREQRRSKQ